MDPMQMLMQLISGGGMAGGQPMPIGLGQTEMPLPPAGGGMPLVQPPTQAPDPLSQAFAGLGMGQPTSGGAQRQSMGPSAGLSPRQAMAPPLPRPKPAVPGVEPAGGGPMNPQMLAALEALQAPEDENRGPPNPPAAPAQPNIEPGMLFEALMKLGIHPGQFPQLTQNLRRQ